MALDQVFYVKNHSIYKVTSISYRLSIILALDPVFYVKNLCIFNTTSIFYLSSITNKALDQVFYMADLSI